MAIEDVTAFVREQHARVIARRLEELVTPAEDVFAVRDPEVARRLGVSSDASP